MLEILTLTVPIYLAIAVGYVVVRAGIVPAAGLRALGAFVVNVALPALLFSAIASRDVREIANPTYVLAYGISGVVTFWLVWLVARRLERVDSPAAACHGMGAMCPNSAFVGLPMLLLVLPPVAELAFGLNMLVENLLLIPMVLFVAERGVGHRTSWVAEVGGTLSKLARNPLIIGIVLGVVVSLLGIRLPDVLTRSVDLFARASTGVALFTVGGLLVGVSVKGMVRALTVVTAGKLVVQPLLTYAALAALVAVGLPDLSPELRMALVLSAGMPVFSIYPVLAQKYGHERLASAGLLASTALSFVTLSGLLAVLR